jgi:hypothetical protein
MVSQKDEEEETQVVITNIKLKVQNKVITVQECQECN